jgi:hypothetical protein
MGSYMSMPDGCAPTTVHMRPHGCRRPSSLLTPRWGADSSCVSAQAIDRCHRLGQTRDVVVTKLITAHHRPGQETAEQRMLGIQVPRRCRVCSVTLRRAPQS